MAGVYVIIDMNMKNESAWEAHRLFAGAAVDGLGCFLNQFVSMKRRPALHFEVDTLPNLSVTRLAPFDFQHLTMQKAKVLLTPASFVDNHRDFIMVCERALHLFSLMHTSDDDQINQKSKG